MNLFAGAWETRDVTPLPVDIPQATDDQVRQLLVFIIHTALFFISIQQCTELFYIVCYFFSFNINQVQRCIELVSRAKKPVILLGSQATLPPTPADDIRLRTMSYAPFFLCPNISL